MSTIALFITALLGSCIPIIIWLWFLEHEDKHPEPLKLTFLAFVGGMLAVILVVYPEKWSLDVFGMNQNGLPSTETTIIWAFLEEMIKFLIAALLVLNRAENDEPIDSVMYMIATALGFSLLENTLYVLHPLLLGSYFQAIIMSNFRFLGATILHTISSSTIGAFLALSYYKNIHTKRVYLFWGIILAGTLHSAFNLSIMNLPDTQAALPFYCVWIAFIVMLLVFEKIKHISK